MSIAWYFKKASPGDRARESQVEKFFNSDAVADRANAIVREGIQNSLDAAPDNAQVRVRIKLGVWSAEKKATALGPYTRQFTPHFDVLKSKLSLPPANTDDFRYLVFEDFGTSGLRGDPAQWWTDENDQTNPFFNFFRAEGISDKVEGARGRHGVGRLVFMFASRTRSIFGLTRRDDGRAYLMGTSVLRNHRFNQEPYLPDAWFGVPCGNDPRLTLPVDDSAFLSQFRRDFDVARRNESGLSVVVPWLSSDVNASEIIRSVVSGYFHPVLRKMLEVEVISETGQATVINAKTISDVVESHSQELAKSMMPVLALTKASLASSERITIPLPDGHLKWSTQKLPDDLRVAILSKLEAGELLSLRVPMYVTPKTGANAGQDLACHFDVFLLRDAAASEGQVLFIREGIIITDARHTDNRQLRCPGIRAIVVIDEGAITSFLGDCENPSHTQWQHIYLRDTYKLHRQTLEYVVGAVPAILRILSDQQKKPDASLLIDLFSLPAENDSGPKIRRKKEREKDGTETDEPELELPRLPKRLVIDQSRDGFVIRRGDPTAVRPPLIEVEVAYGVRRKSPFSKYNKADFRLGKGDIKCSFRGCEPTEIVDNWMQVQINEDDFEINVTGFDTKRDLHIDCKAKEKEVADAAAL